jgi:predicted DNA-binding transcriptional regulator AlpA
MRWVPQLPPCRRLNRKQAAAYCGISPTLFDLEVKEGRYPKPISKGPKGGRKVWDLKVLDRALDREAGIAAPVEDVAGGPDPLLDAIHRFRVDRRERAGDPFLERIPRPTKMRGR